MDSSDFNSNSIQSSTSMSILYPHSILIVLYTIGIGICLLNSNPLLLNSCAKHSSYADSNIPGPRILCTSMAEPIISLVRQFNCIVLVFPGMILILISPFIFSADLRACPVDPGVTASTHFTEGHREAQRTTEFS